MNVLAASVLMGCLALSAAQLGATPSPVGSGTAMGPLTSSSTSGGGPLANVPNPAATSTNTNNGLSRIFRNSLMTYGLMGGDNLKRAFMLPFLSGLGGSHTANYYYLRGGMDNYAKVMMSDIISRTLAQSTGMSPFLSAMFAGQMADAPDNYALSNMIFNGGRFGGNNGRGNGGNGGNGGSSQAQGLGLLPMGAASPFLQATGGFSSVMNPLALASMSMA